MKTVINGKEVSVEVIGGFRVEDLDKEYALCTYDDEANSDKVMMVILELNVDEYGFKTLVSIPDEEKEIVLECYKAVKQNILNGGE